MGRSQNSFNKSQKEKKKEQKKKDKLARKEERKSNAREGTLQNMMAYVDEFGNILDSPSDSAGNTSNVDENDIQISTPKKADESLIVRRGKVDFFDFNKGFGFIIQDGTQEKFFVHESKLKTPIQEGCKVSFKIQKGLKGMDAIDVKKM